MAQHTSGPWQIKSDYTHEDRCTVIANVDGETVYGTTHYTYDTIARCSDEFEEYLNESEANARLIAAAPDLLAALIELVGEELGGDKNSSHRETDYYRPVISWKARQRARAAVAKAAP